MSTAEVAPSPPVASREVRLAGVAEACRRSYARFFKTFWDVIEPGTPLVWNWHLQVICDHLQAVTEGKIKNLIICLPPGHAKSVSVSALWQPWEWIDRPWIRELYGSYDEDLTYRDSLKSRDILRSRRYQELFRPGWSIRRDQDAKGYFQNTLHGSRKTYYMGSRKKTGWRGNHVIVDDPLSAEDRYNRTEKNVVNESFDKVLSTRVNRAEDAAFVVIMQRLATDDLCGYLIDKYGDKYVQLILRSEYDASRPCVTPIFDERDYRDSGGDLLFPALFPRAVVEDFKVRLGPVDYAAQFQHDPVPDAGNRFDSAKFQYWTWYGAGTLRLVRRSRDVELIGLLSCVQFMTVDPACSEKNEGDYTSIGRWAWCSEKNILILLHRVSIQEKEPGIVRAIRDVYFMADFGRIRPIYIGMEANGPGKPIAQAMEGRFPVVEVHMNRNDKNARSAVAVINIDNGFIFFPDPSIAPWMLDVSRQMTEFPGASHDDDVDMISMASIAIFEHHAPQITGGRSAGPRRPQHDAGRNRFDAANSGLFGRVGGNGVGGGNGNRDGDASGPYRGR